MLSNLLRSRIIRQTVVFAGSNGMVSVLTAVALAILARSMTEDEFGSFSFATAFLLFVALFFDFGLVLPAARMSAAAEGDERRGVIGATLLLYAPIGAGFCVAVFATSFFVDGAFNVTAGEALAITAPLAIVYPFQLLAQSVARGIDRLHAYSFTLVAGQAAFVVALLLVGDSVTIESALLLRGIAMLAGWLAFVGWMHPARHRLRHHARGLVQHAREYGFNVYVGRIFSIGSYNMDVLMIGVLTNARTVGLYVLASALGRGVGLPLLAAATALFPRMMGETSLARSWLTAAWVVAVAGTLALWLLAEPLIELLFSERYLDAAPYILPLAAAEALRGVTTFYNSFLAAHARGRELRNTGFALTAANLVLNFALIPPFGGLGAAWASFLALLANFVVHVTYYNRARRDLEGSPPPAVASSAVA